MNTDREASLRVHLCSSLGALMKPDLAEIVWHFGFAGSFVEAGPYGSGHINDTYVASFSQTDGSLHRYILQRINHRVFSDPARLMQNVERVTAHLRQKIIAAGGDPERESLNLVPTVDGKSFHRTPDGHTWRAYVFIEGARTYDAIESLDHVYNVSKAFGRFQELMSDFPPEQLYETIPNFHHTRKRFEELVEAIGGDSKNRARFVRPEIEFVERRAGDASILVDLLDQGQLPRRVTHNDTKFNNVMIDDETGEGICIIDLDTVMPGLALYDFGDSIRSGANSAAEDEPDLSKVWVDLDVFDRFAHGYLDAARGFLTPLEIDYLPFSARLITFENGMRFLADYLNGDVYYKIRREHHNLDRCRTQFKMVQDMEERFDQMVSIVEKYRRERDLNGE